MPHTFATRRAAREASLACFAQLADCADRVRNTLEQSGLLAWKPFFDFHWSFCPPDLLREERRLYLEALREELGTGYEATTTFDRVLIGRKSPVLERLRSSTGELDLGPSDLMRQCSARGRAHVEATNLHLESVTAARHNASVKARERKLVEIDLFSDELRIARSTSLSKWHRAAIERYFAVFGFVPPKGLLTHGVVAQRQLAENLLLCLLLQEPSQIGHDIFLGNFGLNLLIVVNTDEGPAHTKRAALKLVDGFGVYSECRGQEEASLDWFAHSVVFGAISNELLVAAHSSGLTGNVSGG